MDRINWDQTNLAIPKENYDQALAALIAVFPSDKGDLKDIADLPVQQQLKLILNAFWEEWDVVIKAGVHIIIVGNDPCDDFEANTDKVLLALIGLVYHDSFVTCYDDEGKYRQIRYSAKGRDIVHATITFPYSEDHLMSFATGKNPAPSRKITEEDIEELRSYCRKHERELILLDEESMYTRGQSDVITKIISELYLIKNEGVCDREMLELLVDGWIMAEKASKRIAMYSPHPEICERKYGQAMMVEKIIQEARRILAKP